MPAPTATDTPEARTRRRRAEVKRRLRWALLERARHESFRDVKIADVSSAAGLSRSAFYFYYEDKQELLLDAITELSEALLEQADRWWSGTGEPRELIGRAVGGNIALWSEHSELLATTVEAATYDERIAARWRDLVGLFIAGTRDHIAREQRQGRIDPALDAEATATLLIWGAERALYERLARGEGDPEQLNEQLTDLWMRVLYPEPRA